MDVTGCKVELSLSASGLVNLDWFSKSDPLAVCYAGDSRGNFREVGRTECIKDTLNPRFVRTFLLPYIFHETQPLRIELYDMDNKYTLNEQDFIGEVDVLLSEVVTARGGALTKELKYRRPQLLQRRRGYLTLSAEEWHTEKAADTLSFVVRGTRLRANGKVFFTVLRTLARNTYGYVELHARAACARARVRRAHALAHLRSPSCLFWRADASLRNARAPALAASMCSQGRG